VSAEHQSIIDALVAELRRRDTDPAYAKAPVVDPYGRISREYDGWDKEKVGEQIIDCLRKMLTLHMRLGELLADNALSAWKIDGKRPGFERGLERMEAGDSRGMMAYANDRLTRQPKEAERLVELGRHRGIKIWTYVDTELDLTTVDGQATQYQRTQAAWYESAKKSERLQTRYRRQRQRNEFQPKNLFGYAFRGIDEVRLAAERDAIAWGIRYVINRGNGEPGSWKSVADEFNRRGLRTRSSFNRQGQLIRGNEEFNIGKVRNLLINPRHAGYLTLTTEDGTPEGKPNSRGIKTIIGVAKEPGIIDVATWSLFEAVLSGRKGKREKRAGNPRHLLRGVCVCSVCSSMLGGSTERTRYTDGTARRSYRCAATTGCRTVRVDARVLEAVIYEMTMEGLASPKNATRIARRNARLATVDKEIAYWTTRQDELVEEWGAVGPGGRRRMSQAKFREVSDDIMGKLDQLEKERAAIAESDPGVVVVKARHEAEEEWRVGTVEQRQAMILAVYPHGLIVTPAAVARQRATVANTRGRVAPPETTTTA